MTRIPAPRRLMAAAVALATGLALTACGGGTTGDTGGSLVDKAGAPSTPAGTLRMAAWQETPSMDPVRTTTQNGMLIFPEYDTLTVVDAEFQPQPWLATSWTQPDSKTWEFKLRDDVTFHDGSKFDAETVKLNLERAKKVTGGPYTNIYAPISEVEAVDPATVRVSFSTPQPNFPYSMSTVAGAMISPKAVKDETDLTRAAAGSGGWIWQKEAHREGAEHVYKANPDYWNKDAVRAETISVKIMQEDNARLNALQSGQVEVMSTLQPDQADAAQSAGLRVLTDLTSTGTFLIMDREGKKVPAFAKPEVRQAIGLLLDRDAYNKALLSGKGDPKGGGFAAPGSPWHDASLDGFNKADAAKAKELLAQAGYPDGFTFEVGNAPVIRQINETIAQLLKEGGITMKIVDVANGQYTADVRRGRFPAGYFVPTSIDIYQWWSRTVSTKGIYNPFKLDDLDDLEKTFDEALEMTGDGARKPLMNRLQRETVERGVAFPLSQNPRSAALAASVRATQQPVFAPEDIAPRPHYLWTK
ncbi:ABC transporter substrate-binding protein [Actinomadura livida]|uniref:ABC transporter substrate-binding protein n=1 Tax=Actinomadura livida TaxID=79909 RepID=A0A7W7IFB9_9ACTN|nr:MULTISPECIES: ABC transporter substrate-binding protein [Actinomadura]MBB4776079.1 peptide/nickel transport system substrate-binding protein [Actinomadura catellatispora]GGU15645.1 peptide ABC transporter substrate-binding protein [Actinomadura livida]